MCKELISKPNGKSHYIKELTIICLVNEHLSKVRRIGRISKFNAIQKEEIKKYKLTISII